MIRRAGQEDLAALLVVERAAESAPHWSKAIWEETLRSEREMVVAEQQGMVVGFAVGHEVAGVAELESIAVSAAARRGGFGRDLVVALQMWAQGKGAKVMELEVRESNVGAIGFYMALGFREQGRRPKYYANPVEDAVLMAVELQDVEVSS